MSVSEKRRRRRRKEKGRRKRKKIGEKKTFILELLHLPPFFPVLAHLHHHHQQQHQQQHKHQPNNNNTNKQSKLPVGFSHQKKKFIFQEKLIFVNLKFTKTKKNKTQNNYGINFSQSYVFIID